MAATTGATAAENPMRSGRWFGVVLLCLLLTARLSDVSQSRDYGQIPFTLALFVLPLLYAYGPARPLHVLGDQYPDHPSSVRLSHGTRKPAARTA
jgi:hypothetical protein